MGQVVNEAKVQNFNKLLADPIRSMLQTFQTLADDNDSTSFPVGTQHDLYDPARIPCLQYETFNKCSRESCEFLHGQRCPHCCENVLPVWNESLRDQHTSACRARIQELKRIKRYEQQPSTSWLYCRTQDERRNWLVKNQQWY